MKEYCIIFSLLQLQVPIILEFILARKYWTEFNIIVITCINMYNPQVMQWHWRSTCIAYGCMDHQQNPPIAVSWATKGRRSRGQPRETWMTTVEGERQKKGLAN